MTPDVSIGGSRSFDLHRAVLVYRAPGGDVLATVHSVEHGRGSPTLGAGELVTAAFLQELTKGLGSALKPEVLPPHVLARTAQMITWWTPAHRRPLFFRAGSELGELSGKHFPLPALVWKILGRELSVRALRENTRPEASTQLYLAPFWNTSAEGLVCQGSMRRPARTSVAALREWEDGYFGAEFTHVFDAFGAGNTAARGKGGVARMWRSLAGARTSRTPFPVRQLVPAKETLQQFVERGAR